MGESPSHDCFQFQCENCHLNELGGPFFCKAQMFFDEIQPRSRRVYIPQPEVRTSGLRGPRLGGASSYLAQVHKILGKSSVLIPMSWRSYPLVIQHSYGLFITTLIGKTHYFNRFQ